MAAVVLRSVLPLLLVLLSGVAAHRHGHGHGLFHAPSFPRDCLRRPVHKTTFRSPPFSLGRGEVFKKFYDMEMPEGHYAIRAFSAQIVSEKGPVPLNEVYVHHWIAFPVFRPVRNVSNGALAGSRQREWLSGDLSTDEADTAGGSLLRQVAAEHEKVQPMPRSYQANAGSNSADASNDDSCVRPGGSKVFGIGAETRHTQQGWAAPYGMEFGNPRDAPPGKEELLFGQIHVIDTHGAVDAKKCLECFCESYGVTIDERGRPIPPDYSGGLLCCYNEGRCATGPEAEVQAGEEAEVAFPQTLWLEYTVEWVPMDECVVPVKVYFLDVTKCEVEYNVAGCDETGGSLSGCVDTRRRQVRFPIDGSVVYAAGHQHVGGDGITVFKEDGSVVCDSTPLYGRGSGAGNEAGYVTGMHTCVADVGEPGVHVSANEVLTIQSTYSKLGGGHTGVMGLFYMAVVSDEVAETKGWLPASASTRWVRGGASLALNARPAGQQEDFTWGVALRLAWMGFVLLLVMVVGLAVARMKPRVPATAGYTTIPAQ